MAADEREQAIVHSAAIAINSIASCAADVIEALEKRHVAALEGPTQWRNATECVFERVLALSAEHESGRAAMSASAMFIDTHGQRLHATDEAAAERKVEGSELHLEGEHLRTVSIGMPTPSSCPGLEA